MNEKKHTRLNKLLVEAFKYLMALTMGTVILNRCVDYLFFENEETSPSKVQIEMLEPEDDSESNFDFDKKFEQERLKRFENAPLQSGANSASKKRIDTISRKRVKEVGYGITAAEIAQAKEFGFLPKNAKLPASLTKAQADEWFDRITLPTYTKCVERAIGNRPITPEQKFALVSFTHNLGSGCLKKLLCHSDKDIAPQMVRYIYSDKKIRAGLVKRRAWEASLWEAGLRKKVESTRTLALR